MRRKLAFTLPFCFVLAAAAPVAKADPIEQITTTAVGVIPASVTLTLNNPQTEPGLVKVCVKSRSQGQLFCINL